MSGNCNITNKVKNYTGYSFTPNDNSSLSSGHWVISPLPIAPSQELVAFQAIGVKGTATGAVGWAGYDVMSNGSKVGTVTLAFSDPYTGSNSAKASGNTVPGLDVLVDCPTHGGTIICAWSLS